MTIDLSKKLIAKNNPHLSVGAFRMPLAERARLILEEQRSSVAPQGDIRTAPSGAGGKRLGR
jgi:hypothetical protein